MNSFAKEEIINIGTLEVTGEVRKPMVGFVNSQKHLDLLLKESVKKEILELEELILRFKTPKEYLSENLAKNKPEKQSGKKKE